MNPLVVDASVAVKWVVAEPDADKAGRVATCGRPMQAPSHLRPEVANVLWKRASRGLMTPAEARRAYANFVAYPVGLHPTDALTEPALEIAVATGRTVYDCLYVALAEGLHGEAVTADDRLVNGLAGTPWARFVVRLADFP